MVWRNQNLYYVIKLQFLLITTVWRQTNIVNHVYKNVDHFGLSCWQHWFEWGKEEEKKNISWPYVFYGSSVSFFGWSPALQDPGKRPYQQSTTQAAPVMKVTDQTLVSSCSEYLSEIQFKNKIKNLSFVFVFRLPGKDVQEGFRIIFSIG